MTFLPIVERELRVAARKRATYWTRLTCALVAICITSWMIMTIHQINPRALGKTLFITLSVITFFYGLIGGARITADCISEEKREGTLGLLFLTHLKGHDVVFGKLFATSLNAFYGMLAIFPVLAVSILLGGVTFGEFWRVMLVAVNLLFFSLAAGMFCSAIGRDERKTLGLALFVVILISITPWVIAFNLSSTTHKTFLEFLPLFSPPHACYSAFDNPMTKWNPKHFWITVALTHLYAWLFLALACFIVPRCWQDKSAGSRGVHWRNKFDFWTQGSAKTRKIFRTRLLEITPFYWLAARDKLKPRYVWFLLIVVTLVWAWGGHKWPRDWFNPATYIFTAICLHNILKYWLATEACYRFVTDRKSGAMELLLSTPLRVEEIVRGQR
ncbi:MAG: ABC transporter permease, partial [Limisphaerales bacterium]